MRGEGRAGRDRAENAGCGRFPGEKEPRGRRCQGLGGGAKRMLRGRETGGGNPVSGDRRESRGPEAERVTGSVAKCSHPSPSPFFLRYIGQPSVHTGSQPGSLPGLRDGFSARPPGAPSLPGEMQHYLPNIVATCDSLTYWTRSGPRCDFLFGGPCPCPPLPGTQFHMCVVRTLACSIPSSPVRPLHEDRGLSVFFPAHPAWGRVYFGIWWAVRLWSRVRETAGA